MATTQISVSSYQTICAEVADAIIAADWTTAWTKYAAAEAVLAALEQQMGKDGEYLRRRETLKGLRDAIEMAEAKVTRGADRRRFTVVQTAFNE